MEIEAILNESELMDPEPLTPTYMEREILPHQSVEIDSTFGDASRIRKRANVQATILMDFQTRWHHEYLTCLRDPGNKIQSVKKGDVVIVHDDFAVIEDPIVGRDGLTQAAMITTANGTTSRPISRLFPLELTSEQDKQNNHTIEVVNETSGTPNSDPMSEGRRPSPAAATRASNKMKNHCGPLDGSTKLSIAFQALRCFRNLRNVT